RAVEKNQRVDVTTYPLLEEVLGGRGRWDVARMITILLAAFSLASWVLELSMDLFEVKNQAYLLTQPPPVYRKDNEGSSTWEVLDVEDTWPEYDKKWIDLPNVSGTEAKSWYYVEDFKQYAWSAKEDRYMKGAIEVASWSTELGMPDLSYGDWQKPVTVKNVSCSSGEPLKNALVMRGNDEWGSVIECEAGPALVNKTSSQPAIILREDGGDTHVVVEETSKYPSFLYSVWKAGVDPAAAVASDAEVELEYSFHIASSVRLADAVVTGIVNGLNDAGGCFGLIRLYSTGPDTGKSISGYEDHQKASPFGEDPQGGKVDSLAAVETIEHGVVMNMNALVAFAWLMALSAVGIVWSICLRSSIGMDIYDRDELLRAISLQAQGMADDPEKHAAMRIYVQKEGDNLNVIISESDGDKSGCARFLLRRARPKVHEDPVPVVDTTNDGFGGAPLPRGRPRLYLGSVRTGMGRAWPGRLNNFRYPRSPTSSVTSPIPALVSVAGTPVPGRSARGASFSAAKGRGFSAANGRGVSILFESVCSQDSGGSARVADDDPGDDGGGDDMETGSCGRPSAGHSYVPAFDGGTEASSEDARAVGGSVNHGEGEGGGAERQRGASTLRIPSNRTTPPVSEGPSPPPWRGLRTDFTLGPPQIGPLIASAEEETKEEHAPRPI
ncbi:unnamed protein product, partial [Hapterophycus canaliculatus]